MVLPRLSAMTRERARGMCYNQGERARVSFFLEGIA